MFDRVVSELFRIVLISAMLFAFSGLEADAQSAGNLRWITPPEGADLVKLKASIEAQGGTILTLAPEGKLLVRYPSSSISAPPASTVEPYAAPAPRLAASTARGLGSVHPTPEDEERLDALRVTHVEPNTLAKSRAMLQDASLAAIPAAVDNSLSMYFPPIDTQGSLSACTAWATTYYYSTYEQARDENWNAASGNENYIAHPMFVYNLINGGVNTGTVITHAMNILNQSGAGSLALRSSYDVTLWPTEAEWVDALKRRTQSASVIGRWDQGCTDADILAIKTHLANGHIAVTLSDLYQNFYDLYPTNTTGINNGVWFAPGGGYEGGHAMTIVGYDDNKSYWNGSQTKYGAFLVANSWGSWWGTYNSTGASKGFVWVAYEFFKRGAIGDGHYVFGTAYFNTDREDYRSKVYAVAGVNHTQRGHVTLYGGVGTGADQYWWSENILQNYGGTSVAINDSKRVVIDLNDGIPYVAFPSVDLFVRMELASGASSNGTLTNTTFFHDFDGNGTYDQVQAGNTPRTATPGGHADAETVFTWSDGLIDHLSMPAVASPQYANNPMAATITARDNLERVATGFTGTATLSAVNITTSTIGTGTVEAWIPFGTSYMGIRTQSIYLRSELGQASVLQGLALDVTAVPGGSVQNFTIRMKHTTQSVFSQTPNWETGYTTVYRHNVTITKTGWMMFQFDTPFSYNGIGNLMIDLSFNNPGFLSDGWIRHTDTWINRTTYGGGNYKGDPLNWTGNTPGLIWATLVPNVKLITGRLVSITPTTTGNFSAGVWNGAITFNEAAENVYLTFSDGAGHAGITDAFNVLPGIPPGALTVTLGPSGAVSAGAQWRRAGTSTWRASGSSETGIPVGSYTIECSPLAGWLTPPTQQVTISSGVTASASASYTQMSSLWVDFGYSAAEFGTEAQPFCRISSGVSAVTAGGTVYIKSGTSNERPRITKPVRLEAVGGTATIGR